MKRVRLVLFLIFWLILGLAVTAINSHGHDTAGGDHQPAAAEVSRH
ncbi:MAG: hypothetical protein XD51_1214 [Moorella sp. 60_41]|nr:MAG: hypothetical protein XD51_1214 [Moorella sp. 60_41]